MSFEKLEDFDEIFGMKLLSCLMNERDYLVQIHDAIDIQYFDNVCHRWLVDKTLEYYYKYKTNPTPKYLTDELKKFKKSNEKNVPTAKEIYKLLKTCIESEFDGLEYIVEGFYKIGNVRLFGQGDEIYVKSRYNETDLIEDIHDLTLVNRRWWKNSCDRFEGWRNPDSNWLPILEKYGLIENETNVVVTYK